LAIALYRFNCWGLVLRIANSDMKNDLSERSTKTALKGPYAGAFMEVE